MNDATGLTPQQLGQIEEVVRRAVRAELSAAGLRLDAAEDQDEAREDFRFLRRMRRAADNAASRVGYVILTIAITAVVAAFWAGTQALLSVRGQG